MVLLFSKGVLKEYKLLGVRMNDDLHFVPVVKIALEFLCDVEVIIGSIASCPCWR
jgi:hypothetical protein